MNYSPTFASLNLCVGLLAPVSPHKKMVVEPIQLLKIGSLYIEQKYC